MSKFNLIKISILFLTVLTLSSCSSDDTNTDDNGITTGNYLPLAVGNKWNYTNGSTTSLVQIIGTANFGGTTYYEDDDSGSEIDIQSWAAKKGASYYQKTGDYTFTQGSTTFVLKSYELKVLKDDLAVGESWSGDIYPKLNYSGSSGSGTYPVHISYEGIIIAKNVSATVEGVSYNNVIKVEMNVVQTVNSQVFNINGEVWFAKDIGVIMDTATSTADNITRTKYLTSYELN